MTKASTIIRLGFTLCLIGAAWLLWAFSQPNRFCAECFPTKAIDIPIAYSEAPLESGMAISMDSPVFAYEPVKRWQISAAGADPGQPADPENEPSGVVTFQYQGEELALLIATGNFWGYMLVTVDGEPANLRPTYHPPSCPAETDCDQLFPNRLRDPQGYKTFYEPETQTEAEWRAAIPTTRWMRVHQANAQGESSGSLDALDQNSAAHTVRIEIWRSWGQMPLRGVAIDVLPPEPKQKWPGLLLVVAGIGLIAGYAQPHKRLWQWIYNWQLLNWIRTLLGNQHLAWLWTPVGYWLVALVGLSGLVAGILLHAWWLALLGLAILALTALFSLVPWLAALLFGLPFYFGVTLPLLPGREFGLLDVGIFGGLALVGVRCMLAPQPLIKQGSTTSVDNSAQARTMRWLLAILIGWALVTVVDADYVGPALREWRTVFLGSGLFAILIYAALSSHLALGLSIDSTVASKREQTIKILIGAWLLGGTVVAGIGIWQYLSGSMLISAEGVNRVRALYGSPNNLALYLGRTLAVSLALGLLLKSLRWRWIWRGAALIQLVALILTFSKGGLFLGLPTLLLTLSAILLAGTALDGTLLTSIASRRSKNSLAAKVKLGPTIFIWIGGFALLGLFLLFPFLGTERFQRLLDFSQGTSFLRLQLWRNAWEMALDHPFLGVGPDNFLYSYRRDYVLPAAWQERNLNHPHNWFLDWWTRLGVVGLIVGLSLWGIGIWRIIKRLRVSADGHGFEYALRVGSLAAVAASLAHGLIDASYALPDLMIVWVLLFFLDGITDSV